MTGVERLRQRRISRRRLWQGTALAGGTLAAITAFACGERKPTPPPAAKQPKRGGTLVRRSSSAFGAPGFRGLDPHVLPGAWTGLQTLFYQTLIRFNPRTLDLEPLLAQKWETVSPTELVLTLASGIRFHNKPPANGREMTVDDVVFSLTRARTNDPRFESRTLLDSVDKIEAVDKARVKLTLKQPDVLTLRSLAAFSLAVLAPEVVEKAGGKFTTVETAVGTGAFILQSMDDVSATLVRNPDYWKPGLPYLDSIRTRYFAEDQTMWAAFLGGQLDLSYVPGADAAKVYAERQTKPYIVEWFNDVGFIAIQANTRKKPFDDARVTKALRLLVDHQEAVENQGLFNGRGHLSVAFPPALADWDFSEEEYVTNFLEFRRSKNEAAKEASLLLNAAGFTKDNPLKFTLSASRSNLTGTFTGAQLLQAQFNRHSQGTVQPDLRPVDEGVFYDGLNKQDFEYTIANLVAFMPFDPDLWFRQFYHSKGTRNYGKYSDPALDHMVDKQRTIFDTLQRKAAVKEVLHYLIEHAPYTSWAGRYTLNAWQPKVQDWAPEGNSAMWGYQYEHVWLDT